MKTKTPVGGLLIGEFISASEERVSEIIHDLRAKTKYESEAALIRALLTFSLLLSLPFSLLPFFYVLSRDTDAFLNMYANYYLQ